MKVIESQWWYIDLPEEWLAEQEEDAVVIADRDGVGEIIITTLEKQQGQAQMADLDPFIRELEADYGEGEPVIIADAEGYLFCYDDDLDAIREWYLVAENLIIVITYCCEHSNKGLDDAAVDEIIDTLQLKKNKVDVQA